MVFHPDKLLTTFIAALSGIPVTFEIILITLLISIPIAFLVALARVRTNGIGAKLLKVYVSIIRGTPAIVQIYLLHLALPFVIARYCKEHEINFDVYAIPGMATLLFIFILIYIAILSEMFRGGLTAIDKGQLEAAKAIGLSTFQGYVRIVIPQVAVYTLPVMCTMVTGLVKLSSLSYALSVADITSIAQVEGFKYGAYLEAYLVIAVIYVVINLLIEFAFKQLEKKVSIYHKL